MISVQGVEKSFGRVCAVGGVSFEVGAGQVVGLLGVNGAGKTTTIRMITGFLPPDRGRVEVAGHDTLEDSMAARRSIGYLPESAPVYPEMAVSDFLHFRGRLYGLDRSRRRERVEYVLDRCELGGVRRRRVGQLSKGVRQRGGLAAAILHRPRALVLDEPTSGLDPKQVGRVRTLIRELARDSTILVSSHILPEVEQTCDRVLIMARGRIRADGTPAELYEAHRGASPYRLEVRVADRAQAEQVVATLQAIRGVTEASIGPVESGWVEIAVTAEEGAGDLREALAAGAQARGVLVRELRRESPGLERIFMRLIETDEGAGGAPR